MRLALIAATLVGACSDPQSGVTSVQLLAPNGGETLRGASEISWTAEGDALVFDLVLTYATSDGVEHADEIVSNVDTHPYTWTIPDTTATTDENGDAIGYKIRIAGRDRSRDGSSIVHDESDGPFYIAPPDVADALPSFTWIAPGTTLLDASSSSVAILMWTVSDAEGVVSDAIEYAKIPGTTSLSSCSVFACPTTGAVWSSLVGAGGLVSTSSATRMFDWNVPTRMQGPMIEDRGCYCVRGTVNDSAGQSMAVTAQAPVKF